MNHLLTKSFKKYFVRALLIFFVGLTTRSLVLYLTGINVFTNPFSIISLLYYGAMAMYTAIMYEFYPVEMTMGGGHKVPSPSMLEASNTKKSGVLAMNNTTENPSSPLISPCPSLTEENISDIEAETNTMVDNLKMETGVIRELIENHGENPSVEEELNDVELAKKSSLLIPELLDDIKNSLKEELAENEDYTEEASNNLTSGMSPESEPLSEGSLTEQIVNQLDDECAVIERFVDLHTRGQFESIEKQLSELEKVKESSELIPVLLDDLENRIKEKQNED